MKKLLAILFLIGLCFNSHAQFVRWDTNNNTVFWPTNKFYLSVTNAGNTSYSLINASNPPSLKIKSISAGSNVTLTDEGTNIVVAATGGGSSYITPLAHTLTTISNSTVETDVLSVTITNNTLTTGKKLRVKLWGDYLRNGGGNVTNIVKLGSTRMYQDGAGQPTATAIERIVLVELVIKAVSNTSQELRMFITYGNAGTADIGTGDSTLGSLARVNTFSGTASEDMTSGDKTFAFSVNFSAADANLYWEPISADVELLSQ